MYLYKQVVLKQVKLLLFFLIVLIFPFSPYFSYILSLISLLFFYSRERKAILLIIFLIGCWSQLFILNSKAYIVELEYDLSFYYSAYLENLYLSFGDIIRYYAPEIGWYLIYKIIGFLSGDLEVYHIAIINTLLCEFIFLIWLNVHGLREIPKQSLGVVLGLTLLFLWPSNFAFFQRQSISVVFLLFAISNINKFHKFVVYLLIASCFHISSLLMGVIYLIIQKNRLKQFVVITILFLFTTRFLFNIIINIISTLGIDSITRKLNFYINDGNLSFLALSELRFMPLFFFILLFYKQNKSYWKQIALFTAVFYISLLGIQFASGRMNFILFYLYGIFLFSSLEKQPKILILYSIFYFMFDILYKSGVVFSINDNFWQRYGIISQIPFYYIK